MGIVAKVAYRLQPLASRAAQSATQKCHGRGSRWACCIGGILFPPCYSTAAAYSAKSMGRAESSSADVDEQLDSFLHHASSNAFGRILCSPLRRCAVTHTVLPKGLMFQVAVQRRGPTKREPAIAAAGLEDRLRLALTEGRKRHKFSRRPRYLRREAVRSIEAGLMRSLVVLKHKVATSITEESRRRFEEQLAHTKRLLAELKTPVKEGEVVVFGILRPESRPHERGGDLETRGGKFKRGVWCLLHREAAEKLVVKRLSRRLTVSDKAPKDLCNTITEQLVERIMQELELLLKRVQSMSKQASIDVGWITKRVRGSELRRQVAVTYGQGMGRNTVLQDGSGDDVAAVLQLLPQKMPAEAHSEKTPDEPESNGCSLFPDEKQVQKIQAVLAKISGVMQRRVGAGQREVTHDTITKRDTDATKETPPAQSERQYSPYNNIPPSAWPRLYKINKIPLTADLCIALWRLQVWRNSDVAFAEL